MDQLPNHRIDTRPWGQFEQFTLNEPTTVKILTVKAGEAFSLQTHEHRDEFWRVLAGSGTIRIGSTDHAAHAGDAYFIPRHTEHRITGSSEDITVLEIAFGNFDEGDIKRLEDKYGRS